MHDTPEPRQPMVVIVDDHGPSRRYAAAIARSLGLRAKTFADPLPARRRIPQLRPALLVVDLNLSGANGLDLLQWLQRRWPEAAPWPRVVAVSAEKLGEQEQGADLVDQFLLKPFDAGRLRDALAAQPGHASPAAAGSPRPGLRERFVAELREGIGELDHGLSEGRLGDAACLLHRLLGGSALLGEGGLERRLRALLRACREDTDKGHLARRYYELRAEAEYRLAAKDGGPGTR